MLLRDEFHLERARVLRPVSLCAPVQKNFERVEHPVRHLVCYRIRARGRFRPRLARVRNQFGTELVVALRPRTLCAPSIKLRLPPPVQPPPPPDQPPGPCAGIFQRGATPNSIRWSARCQGAFNRLRVVTPGRQILNPVNEPAGLSCQTTTTSTPNDTRDCTGNVAAGTGVGGDFGTNPQSATNQGGQGAALNGAAQTDFNFQGPNP